MKINLYKETLRKGLLYYFMPTLHDMPFDIMAVQERQLSEVRASLLV